MKKTKKLLALLLALCMVLSLSCTTAFAEDGEDEAALTDGVEEADNDVSGLDSNENAGSYEDEEDAESNEGEEDAESNEGEEDTESEEDAEGAESNEDEEGTEPAENTGIMLMAEDVSGEEETSKSALEEAIAAGATEFTMTEDITVEGRLAIIGHDFTLDLNGHTFTGGSLQCINGSLTVQNGSIVRGSRDIDSNGDTGAAILALNFTGEEKTVRFENVTIQSAKEANEVNLAVDIEALAGKYNIELDDCVINAPFYFYGADALLKDCTLEISEYNSVNAMFDVMNSNVIVEGGNYTGCGNAVLDENRPGGGLRNSTLVIRGGTFSNVTAVEDFVEDGYKATENADGTWSVVSKFVAQVVDGDKYETLAAAIEAAKDGDTVVLLADVTVDETYASNASLEIRKALTIDGQGQYTITCQKEKGIRIFGVAENEETMKVVLKDVTVTNANDSGRTVETRGGNVELELDNATLTTTGGGNTQVLTVGGNRANATTVTIQNGSKLIASKAGYGIITFNPVNMTIDNSEVSGYGAMQLKGIDSSAGSAGSVVNVVNGAKLSSQGIDGSSNAFGTIVFYDDNVTVNIKDSTVITNADGTTSQTAFMYNSSGVYGTAYVTISGDSYVILTGDYADFETKREDKQISFTVSGGTFSTDVSEYCVEGFKAALGENGLYHIVEREYVAQVGEDKYETLAEAIKAANSGDTVTLLADIEVESTLPIDKAITIDGNGYTLSRKSDGVAGSFSTYKVNPAGEDLKAVVRKTFDTTGTIDFSMLTVAENASLTLSNVKVDEGATWEMDSDYELDTFNGPLAKQPLIKVGANATLNLTGCEIKGIHMICGGGVILVSGADVTISNTSITGCVGTAYGMLFTGNSPTADGGTVTLKDGAKIEDNYNYGQWNHAMFQIINKYTMVMEDGSSVSNNYYHGNGGAIGVYDWGVLIINGGKVNGNRFVSFIQDNPGGTPIYGNRYSTFIMNGGEICDNISEEDGGPLMGGGWTSVAGPVKLDLNGGLIARNISTKYAAWDYNLTINGGNVNADGYVLGKDLKVEGDIWVSKVPKSLTSYATIDGKFRIGSSCTSLVYNYGDMNGDVYSYGTETMYNYGTIKGDIYFSGATKLINHGDINKSISYYVAGKDAVTISDTRLTNFRTHKDLRAEGYVVIETANDDGTWTYALGKPAEGENVSVSLDQGTASLTVGSTTTLNATVNPENAVVTWTSSDESVATVENGVVTAVAAGTATITAKVGNVTAACEVTVRPAPAPTTGGGTGGGGGGGTVVTPAEVEIEEPDVPLAGGAELNRADHTAYISGYADGTVRPESKLTREEVATIFYRLLTDQSRAVYETNENSFSDVDAGRWSNTAISTLANAGIITGYADGTFRPGSNVTRAELVAMAARFDDVAEVADNPFSDTEGHWAKNIISFAASKGWVNGYTDGSFRPDAPITRAEAMKLINQVLGRQVDAEGLLENVRQWPDNDAGKWYYTVVLEATTTHSYERRSEDGITENWVELNETTPVENDEN